MYLLIGHYHVDVILLKVHLTHKEPLLKLSQFALLIEFVELLHLTMFLMLSPSLNNSILHSLKIDRKSTRLNSSHVAISYAVFCLKKKKKKNNIKNKAEQTTQPSNN